MAPQDRPGAALLSNYGTGDLIAADPRKHLETIPAYWPTASPHIHYFLRPSL